MDFIWNWVLQPGRDILCFQFETLPQHILYMCFYHNGILLKNVSVLTRVNYLLCRVTFHLFTLILALDQSY